jgi:ferredoxin-NADP reductase
VAAGIGITPLKSMAEYAHDLNLKTPVVLVYGNSSPEEISFRAQLDALQAANPYFKVVYTVSRPDRAWQGRVGRITSDLLQEAAEQYDQPLFYLAGPPSMVVRSHETLIELGFEPEQIRYEIFRGYQ